MTTIIIVVVVALVFFVAVCVVTFMVWKRESEMRTDSIKAIEQNLEKLAQELSPDEDPDVRRVAERHPERINDVSCMGSIINESRIYRTKKKIYDDPFEWVRESGEQVHDTGQGYEDIIEPVDIEESLADRDVVTENKEEIHTESLDDDIPEEKSPGDRSDKESGYESISDGGQEQETGIMEIDLDFIDDMDNGEKQNDAVHDKSAGYDTGRSGRKYTASELETLIKE